MRGAASLALAGLLCGCFPDNPRARHISYAAEIGAMVAGGLVLAIVPPPGDCNVRDTTCRAHRGESEALGSVLLFGGVIAAVTTLISAQDAPPAKR